MDWRCAAHLQFRAIVPGSQGSRRTAESVSQADSAGSIPVTRSNVKPQVSGIIFSLMSHRHDVSFLRRARCVPDEPVRRLSSCSASLLTASAMRRSRSEVRCW
jgi:hypothetical protein